MQFYMSLVILLFLHVEINKSTSVKRETSEEAKIAAENFTNQIRSDTAHKFGIAKMNELKWDERLQKIADGFNCHNGMGYVDTIVTRIPDQKEVKRVEYDKNKLFATTQVYGGIVGPEQTGVACREFDSSCHYFYPYGICITGPKGHYNWHDYEMGPPGSACPGGSTDNGLCVVGNGGVGIEMLIYFLGFSIYCFLGQ